MFRLIGTLIASVGLLLGATQTAVAHGKAYNHYDSPRHYRVSVIRDDNMPRWLRKERGFRGWYRHSTLRHNHHLRWWQLYEIYRWEKRFDRRRHHSAYNRHHSYDWYRRYWRDYDHQRRHDRRDDRHNDLRRRRSYE
jgi:hypothetical protein